MLGIIVNGYELLDEELILGRGSFRRVRRWYKGCHPELGGTIVKGYTGLETVVVSDVLKPMVEFVVEEAVS